MKQFGVQFREEDGVLAVKWLPHAPTVQEIDWLIEKLVIQREALGLTVPDQPPTTGETVHALNAPRVALGGALSGNLLVAIRHPGLGWITLALDEAGVAAFEEGIPRYRAQQQQTDQKH